MKIAIVADSNSGVTQDEAKKLGIYVLPMPFMIDGQIFYEGIDLSHEEFYRRMEEGADITTSQPSPKDVMEQWEQLWRIMIRWCTFPCPADSAVPVRQPLCWQKSMRGASRW